jgi:hypothetical protein
MPLADRFSAAEWRTLQFSVLDVFTMVTKVEGPTGMDAREKDAFVRLLGDPGRIRDPLLREVMAALSDDFAAVVAAYKAQYRFEPAYFEAGFRRAGTLLDARLPAEEAREFKSALTVVVGGYLADASDDARGGTDTVGEQEMRAITVIARWLGAGIGA